MSGKSYLIVAASIGSGHMRAAEALGDAIKTSDPTARVFVVDFTQRAIAFAPWLMKAAYMKMLALWPNLYASLYRLSGGETAGDFSKRLLAAATKESMRRLVVATQADAVICTHPFPEAAAADLKAEGASFLFAVVLTDFSYHAFWQSPGVDAFFVATEAMKQALEQSGAKGKVYVTGIPIHAPVEIPTTIKEPPAVLLMGGGLGLGGMERALKTLEGLPEELEILVVAGRNRQLYHRAKVLAKHARHTIKVWGFTDEVPVLMRRAQLLVTKPGGLTISEAWASGLPLFLHEPIPGPEMENAMYAQAMGTAAWARDDEALAIGLERLLRDEGRLQAMRLKALKAAKPKAAEDIFRILQALLRP